MAARPELLDHFILQVDDQWSTDAQALQVQMSERKLLTEIWAANQFLSDGDLPALFSRVTETADAITSQLLKSLKAEFQSSTLEVITLGKWGGREMGLRSDLDFIFVTPQEPTPEDFKVARRLISRMVYDVDLRLRPSGQSGPLLVTKARLHDYWKNEVKPWERQAYLKARSLSPNISLMKSHLLNQTLTPADLAELKSIREKLMRPISEDSLDIKYAPGGLIDIELVVQTGVLVILQVLEATDTVGMIQHLQQHHQTWEKLGPELQVIYVSLRRFEQMLQLASAHRTSELNRRTGGFQKATAIMKVDQDKAWKQVRAQLEDSRALLAELELHLVVQ